MNDRDKTREELLEEVRLLRSKLEGGGGELEPGLRLLRENETVRSILHHIPVMIAVYDRDGSMLFLNHSFTALTGWEETDFRDKEPMECFFPDPAYRSEVWSYMCSARQAWKDLEVSTKNGGRLPSAWSNVRLSSGLQVGIGVDVSKRKMRELHLKGIKHKLQQVVEERTRKLQLANLRLGRESRFRKRAAEIAESRAAELESTLESIADGVVILDPEMNIVRINPAAERMIGYRPELDEMPLDERVLQMRMRKPGGEVPKMHELPGYRASRTGEEVRNELFVFQDEQGNRTWTSFSAAPIRDPEGRQRGAVLILTDVTRIVNLEHRQEKLIATVFRERARLRAIFDHAPEGIVVTDGLGRIVLLNRAAKELLADWGADTRNLQEAGCRDLRYPLLRSATEGKRFSNLQGRMTDPAGNKRDILVNTAPVQDKAGAFTGAVGIFQDVTAIRKDHLERMKLLQRLQKKSRELEGEKRKAEEASKAKSRFMAVMSHEVRTPLSNILGLTDVALHHAGESENTDNLRLIQESAQTLLRIVDDMLDLSRIEAGKLRIRPSSFDLRRWLRDLCSDYAAQTEKKGIEFRMHVDQELPAAVYGDPLRTSQVLRNLLANALKFTRNGRIEIRAEKAHALDRDDWVRFLVSDTGPGIPAGQQYRLFESFTQLDPAQSGAGGGSGLGLAICKQIAEALQGTIEVQSAPGEGSTFMFTLPLPQGQVAQEAQEEREQRRPDSLEDLPRLRILLAEDDRIHQIYLGELIRKAGHELEVASTGKEALHALSGQSFDLILMDIQMPEMSGLEATERIRKRQSPADPEIPIIALTAHGMQEEREAFLRAGMDAHVVKPVDLGELARILSGVCSRGRAEA